MADASLLFKAHYDPEVFLEVAVPHVIACLAYPAYPLNIDGIQEWSEDRLDFYKFIPSIITGKHA